MARFDLLPHIPNPGFEQYGCAKEVFMNLESAVAANDDEGTARLSAELSDFSDAAWILSAEFGERYSSVLAASQRQAHPHPSIEDVLSDDRRIIVPQRATTDWVELVEAFSEAIEWVNESPNRELFPLPLIVAAKAQIDKNHYLSKRFVNARSQELVSPSDMSLLGSGSQPVAVYLHGGEIFTPDDMRAAKTEGANYGLVPFNQQRIEQLLADKMLPDGRPIRVYVIGSASEIDVIEDPFALHATVMPLALAQEAESGYLSENQSRNNIVFAARTSSTENGVAYHRNMCKLWSVDTVGNHHRFDKIDGKEAEGRSLFVSSLNLGLNGYDDLDNIGRFPGVQRTRGPR